MVDSESEIGPVYGGARKGVAAGGKPEGTRGIVGAETGRGQGRRSGVVVG